MFDLRLTLNEAITVRRVLTEIRNSLTNELLIDDSYLNSDSETQGKVTTAYRLNRILEKPEWESTDMNPNDVFSYFRGDDD